MEYTDYSSQHQGYHQNDDPRSETIKHTEDIFKINSKCFIDWQTKRIGVDDFQMNMKNKSIRRQLRNSALTPSSSSSSSSSLSSASLASIQQIQPSPPATASVPSLPLEETIPIYEKFVRNNESKSRQHFFIDRNQCVEEAKLIWNHSNHNNDDEVMANFLNDRLNGRFYNGNFENNRKKIRSSIPHQQILPNERVLRDLSVVGRFFEILQTWPLPPLTFTTICIGFLMAIFIFPRSISQIIIFPAFRLSFGTLYPAYSSYKAVRTKNVKEYVKWMMYWIVFAFFTCIETITDIFLSWFPFYYEVKVIIVLWLLSPATKGSSTLYRKFVHPMLTRREQEIDEYLNQAKERGYSAVIQLGSKGVNYATNVIMQTALKTIHYSLNTTTTTTTTTTTSSNDPNIRALPSSQSDNAIYARSARQYENDMIDMPEALWLPRSNSLNVIGEAIEFSEEDDQMPNDLQNVEQFDDDEHAVYGELNEFIGGAARSREAPKRKTRARTNKAAHNKQRKHHLQQQQSLMNRDEVTNQKVTAISALNSGDGGGGGGIRGRRKLREATPDIDVEI